jgi:hypothetical protein
MYKLKFYFFSILLFFSIPLLAQMEPLKISLPQPMFVGTPSNFNVENLEEPLGRERPSFLAPAGTENVALNKPVYSSYEPRKGELWRITDGYKEATSYSFVELGEGHQYITIDLEDLYTIYAVTIWHYHMSARVYHSIVVQVSDDPDFIMDVQTIFNNDSAQYPGSGRGRRYELCGNTRRKTY